MVHSSIHVTKYEDASWDALFYFIDDKKFRNCERSEKPLLCTATTDKKVINIILLVLGKKGLIFFFYFYQQYTSLYNFSGIGNPVEDILNRFVRLSSRMEQKTADKI
jgi:hypothetical protein